MTRPPSPPHLRNPQNPSKLLETRTPISYAHHEPPTHSHAPVPITTRIITSSSKMDYLIRFAQTHEPFRLAELNALTQHLQSNRPTLQISLEIVDYTIDSPFCIVRFHTHPISATNNSTPQDESLQQLHDDLAASLISPSILPRAIYALWSTAPNYTQLHTLIKANTSHLWDSYKHVPFRFTIDSYMGKRTTAQKNSIINDFRYLGFEGQVNMRIKPKGTKLDKIEEGEEFCVMEEWKPEIVAVSRDSGDDDARGSGAQRTVTPANLNRVSLGRKVGMSSRYLVDKHDLKKRPYISTTSMDAELALVTANLALAAPGKLFLDSFCGTGGFMVAAAELGAFVLGCDIDGRSFRGKGLGLRKGVGANFERYGLEGRFGDCFTADLVNTPLVFGRERRWVDGIIADPPYGVREGLKVLGSRKPEEGIDGEVPASKQPHFIDGLPAHTLPGFVAPKRPYSFVRMLDDILEFAAMTLVDGGRLAFWMPSANENEFGEEEVTDIPQHRLMELKHECIQRFNKWSRRLLVYQRRPGNGVDNLEMVSEQVKGLTVNGHRADDLNSFRKRYFQAFAANPNG